MRSIYGSRYPSLEWTTSLSLHHRNVLKRARGITTQMSTREEELIKYLNEKIGLIGAKATVRDSTLSLEIDSVKFFERRGDTMIVMHDMPYPGYDSEGKAVDVPFKSEIFFIQQNDGITVVHLPYDNIEEKENQGYHLIPQKDAGTFKIPGKLTNDVRFVNNSLTINIELNQT